VSQNESDLPVSHVPTLTPEERAARYEELRRRSVTSRIFARAKDPGIAVRWVRRDTNNHDVSLHEYLGFKIAKDNPKRPKEQRRFETAVPLGDDGIYVCGDVILMEISREDYEFYLSEGVARSRAQMDSGKAAFHEEAHKAKVPTFERDQNGRMQGLRE
jgi:hypothetical protein